MTEKLKNIGPINSRPERPETTQEFEVHVVRKIVMVIEVSLVLRLVYGSSWFLDRCLHQKLARISNLFSMAELYQIDNVTWVNKLEPDILSL